MNVAVFGLGYVGSVTAACLASLGHSVIGVDPNEAKVDAFNQGQSPVAEPEIDGLLSAAVAAGQLEATIDPARAVQESELALISVGTPSRSNGDIDTQFIERVVSDIGAAVVELGKRDYLIVIRSTVVPGTASVATDLLRELGADALETRVAANPEFLREGQAVSDFMNPPLILVGADDDRAAAQVLALYDGVEADRRIEPLAVTEMVKYANNSWHATKVTFANEIGLVAKSLGVDGTRVMELLCLDHKLNISAAYLRPGFAFGGSCLPKDVRALNFMAKSNDVVTPMLSSLLVSNSVQVQQLIDQLVAYQGRKIGFIGLSFKADTDDLRESPIVEVVERLLGKGFDCSVHDADISTSELIGGNRTFIEAEIPHLDRLLAATVEEVIDNCDVLVVSKASLEVREALARRSDNQILVDLVGLDPQLRVTGPYVGVAW